MWFIRFMRSTPGRVLRVAFGVWLILQGALSGSLFGLVLMMVGMVPAVTGIAGICLLDEAVKAIQSTGGRPNRPREHHA